MKRWTLIIIALLLSAPVDAGEFRVAPIKVFLHRGVKSELVSVINDGKESIKVETEVVQWWQDEEGKDRYSPTKDIIYYPKVMVIKPGKMRSIRLGLKTIPEGAEKTYRIFIQEIPQKERDTGFAIRIALRFGIPIFVLPEKERVAGSVESVSLEGGKLTIWVKNLGNVHFRINKVDVNGVDVAGRSIFKKSLAGWYVLHGKRKLFEVKVPEEVCKKLKELTISVDTDKEDFSSRLDVKHSMCSP